MARRYAVDPVSVATPASTPSFPAPAYFSFPPGQAARTSLLRDGLEANAVFCGDDAIALGVLAAICGAEFAVPQTGVPGLNDMEMAGKPGQDLTEIRLPAAEIINAAPPSRLRHPERRFRKSFPAF